MAHRRRSCFGHEADQNAIAFIGVCSNVVAPSRPQCPSPDPPSARLVSLVVRVQAHSDRGVVGSVVFLCVVYPTIYVGLLLPLFAFDLGFELWLAYFYGCNNAAALWFAAEVRRAAFGERPPLRSMALAWAASTAMIIACFVSTSCLRGGPLLRLSASIFGVCSCIYFPGAHGLLLAVRRGEMVPEAMWLIVGMSLGAMPCAIAVVALVYVREHGLIDSSASLAACLLAWTVLPWPFKLAGKAVWQRASPKCRAFGPVLFLYYVDYAFNCLGVCIFSFSTTSVMAHAMGFAATLAMHYLRGTERAYSLSPSMGTLSLHRTMVFMEAFAALLGRLAAHTCFLCFGSCDVVFGQGRSGESGRRSILGHSVVSSLTASLYRGYNIGAASLLGAALAGALVSCFFAGFCQVLPYAWTAPTAKVHPEGDEAAGTRRRRATGGADDAVARVTATDAADDAVRRIHQCTAYGADDTVTQIGTMDGADDAVTNVSTADTADDAVRRINQCTAYGADDAVTQTGTSDGADDAGTHIGTTDGTDEAVTHPVTTDGTDGSVARVGVRPQGAGRTETAGSAPRAQPDIESGSTSTPGSEPSRAPADAAGRRGLERIRAPTRSWICDLQLAVDDAAGIRQEDILMGFLRTYWTWLISMSVFANALTLLLLNAADSIILGSMAYYCLT